MGAKKGLGGRIPHPHIPHLLLEHVRVLRLFSLLFLFSLLVLYAVFRSARFQDLMRRRAETLLSEALKRKVTIGGFDLALVPPAFLVKDVAVANDPRGLAAPCFSAAEVSLRGIPQVSETRIDLPKVRLIEPHVVFEVFGDGTNNFSSIADGPAEGRWRRQGRPDPGGDPPEGDDSLSRVEVEARRHPHRRGADRAFREVLEDDPGLPRLPARPPQAGRRGRPRPGGGGRPRPLSRADPLPGNPPSGRGPLGRRPRRNRRPDETGGEHPRPGADARGGPGPLFRSRDPALRSCVGRRERAGPSARRIPGEGEVRDRRGRAFRAVSDDRGGVDSRRPRRPPRTRRPRGLRRGKARGSRPAREAQGGTSPGADRRVGDGHRFRALLLGPRPPRDGPDGPRRPRHDAHVRSWRGRARRRLGWDPARRRPGRPLGRPRPARASRLRRRAALREGRIDPLPARAVRHGGGSPGDTRRDAPDRLLGAGLGADDRNARPGRGGEARGELLPGDPGRAALSTVEAGWLRPARREAVAELFRPAHLGQARGLALRAAGRAVRRDDGRFPRRPERPDAAVARGARRGRLAAGERADRMGRCARRPSTA